MPAGADQSQPVARRTGGMTLAQWLDWFTRHPDATAPSGVAGMLVQEIYLLRERLSSDE
jgi:hypothetical protein